MDIHIIFDLDGTLIDSSPSILSSFSTTLLSHNIQPAKSLDSSLIGPPLRETLSKLTESDDSELLDRLSATFKSYYDTEGYKSTEVFPGVHELLAELCRRNIPLYIATNKRLHPARLILEHLNWAKYFRGVYALDSIIPHLSSKAAMLGYLLEEVGIKATQAIYVGDKLEDGLAADGNSLPFFAACWGYGVLGEPEIKSGWRTLYEPKELIMSIFDT
ncbi:MAG: HAD hydrolase-like protein [Candidatus Methylumidiphilus sp.]